MPSTTPAKAIAHFLALFLLLFCAYSLWLITFWPGVLGEDSVAILLEAHNPDAFRSGRDRRVVWLCQAALRHHSTG